MTQISITSSLWNRYGIVGVGVGLLYVERLNLRPTYLEKKCQAQVWAMFSNKTCSKKPETLSWLKQQSGGCSGMFM